MIEELKGKPLTVDRMVHSALYMMVVYRRNAEESGRTGFYSTALHLKHKAIGVRDFLESIGFTVEERDTESGYWAIAHRGRQHYTWNNYWEED